MLEVLTNTILDDIESITWWRFIPRPRRQIWITTEAEDKTYEPNDHSHIQLKVDGKFLSFDMIGEQFGLEITYSRARLVL